MSQLVKKLRSEHRVSHEIALLGQSRVKGLVQGLNGGSLVLFITF